MSDTVTLGAQPADLKTLLAQAQQRREEIEHGDCAHDWQLAWTNTFPVANQPRTVMAFFCRHCRTKKFDDVTAAIAQTLNPANL